MNESQSFPMQVFDPRQGYAVVERRLPHWSQAGTLAFITWRTQDSIPASVLSAWLAERDQWLRTHGVCSPLAPREAGCSRLAPRDGSSRGARGLHWRAELQKLAPELVAEFQRHFSNRWNEDLDRCHGECVLRRPELSAIVADSLLKFDGDRYELTDFVVMPNHVHVLAAFPDEEAMLRQCDSWKHFTAREIQRTLGRRGKFWQQDGFDHLVRSIEQFAHLRKYIAENPNKARLRADEYRHYSKQL
jgi:putative transposase